MFQLVTNLPKSVTNLQPKSLEDYKKGTNLCMNTMNYNLSTPIHQNNYCQIKLYKTVEECVLNIYRYFLLTFI